jgi:MFS family permease
MRRTVLLLALAQALAMTSVSIMILTSALVGQTLATNKHLATLPLALQFTMTMAATLPASFIMRRIGRRNGFMIGACIGVVGGAIMMMAIRDGSFQIFCLGNAVFGGFVGFNVYYRFAAAEAANDAFRAKAISLVMAGGVVAAICARPLAEFGQDLMAPYTFAGGFIFVIGLSAAILLVLIPLKMPMPPAPLVSDEAARPLLTVVGQRRAIVAVVCAMLGYGIMSFVMTATPLAMHFCGYELGSGIGFVIQWHVLGMFVPSFFTGHLIRRFGEMRILSCGIACYVLCIGIGLSGVAIPQFWLTLVLLGLGWNFLYVGATTLLTRCYRSSERTKVQACNDFLVAGTQAVCSFIAGSVQQWVGWQWVLIGAAVPAGCILATLMWGARPGARPAVA